MSTLKSVVLDHPLVRACAVCPFCGGAKDVDLIGCWGCFRSTGLKHGDPAAEDRLDAAEDALARGATDVAIAFAAKFARTMGG